MNRFNKKKIYIYILLGAAAAVILTASSICSGFLSGFRSLCLSPAEHAAGKAGNKISLSWRYISGLLSAASENHRLKEENAKIKSEISEMKIYRNENIKLRSLLELKKKTQLKSIAAEVCGRDINTWFFRFEINKGYKNGIKKNMTVMSDRGLIGRITAVYPYSSTVRTILHNQSMVPGYIVESGSFAILDGEGGISGILRYIYNSSLIDDGQLAVTSGLGDIYPGGLVIGVTEKNSKGEMTVKTFADINTVSRVLVFERD